uniref:Uncharacterized protein n=1 Tax=Tanacetum cinerariifolium TaxID=118510 RepID=A0A6L2P393_TANCI|nr:hypothetical protein [Tanacetum cinerariifolium]
MLLRSSSNPSLNSLIFNHQSSPDHNHNNNNHFFMKKSPSFSLLLTKTSSETDLTIHMISRRHSLSGSANKCTRSSSFLDVVVDEEMICSVGGGGGGGDGRMFIHSLSGSANKCTRSPSFLDVMEDEEMICSVGGGGGDGRMCGGYGGGKGGDHGEGNDETADLYYKTMIDANPSNSLILGNYAKYLKETTIL